MNSSTDVMITEKERAMRQLRSSISRSRKPACVHVFEHAISHQGARFFCFPDTRRERKYNYSIILALPLLRDALIEVVRVEQKSDEKFYYYFRPTPKGIDWWCTRRLEEDADFYKRHTAPREPKLLPGFLKAVDQAGNGLVKFDGEMHEGFLALQRGLISFDCYQDSYYHRLHEILVGQITESGRAFHAQYAAPIGEW